MKNNILFFILFILLYGCYEDKGNYNYTEVNVIGIKEFQTDQWNLSMGDVVELIPILTYSLDSNVTTLTYNWQIRLTPTDYIQIGSEKILKWVADRAGLLDVILTITDTTNGLQCIGEEHIYILDENEYPEGLWQILYEQNGEADLCVMEVYKRYDRESDTYFPACEYSDHVYSLENNGEKLGGSPYSIHEIFADQQSRSHLLILQNGGIGPIYVDGSNYKKTISLQEEFVGGVLPENVFFTDASYSSRGDILLTNTGKIYVRRKTYPEVFYSGVYPDFPAYYERGMEITHILQNKAWNDNTSLLYDNKNHRFLTVIDGGTYYDEEVGEWKEDPNGAAIQSVYTEPLDGFTALNNMGNVDLLYIGIYTSQIGKKYCWDVFKNNDDGKYYMQHFNYVSSINEMMKMIPDYQKVFPDQEILNGENKFSITPDERQFIFFSSTGSTVKGGIQDKLYGYMFTKGTGNAKLLYDFEGKKITSLFTGSGNANYRLAVGLDSGEVYFFEVDDSRIFAGGTINYFYKTEPIFGKIVDIIYAYGSFGATPN